MKKRLYWMFSIFSMILMPFSSSAHITRTILYEGEGVSIVQVNEDGEVFWQVIATIGTAFLPETARAICIRTVGDEDVCNAVYAVTSTLVEIRGVRIVKGVYRSFSWLANRGKKNSSATVSTSMFDVAMGLKDVFETYRELGCVKWESIEAPAASSGTYASAPVILENTSYEDVYFLVSCDEVDWKPIHLKAGNEMDLAFRKQGGQNFGYCRLNGTTFILHAGKTYLFYKGRTNGAEVQIYLKK